MKILGSDGSKVVLGKCLLHPQMAIETLKEVRHHLITPDLNSGSPLNVPSVRKVPINGKMVARVFRGQT